MREFWDFMLKNKYTIICVIIVLVLYALGVVRILFDIAVLIALICGAIFLGKKIQDNEENIIQFFTSKKAGNFKEKVYYYQNKDKDNE